MATSGEDRAQLRVSGGLIGAVALVGVLGLDLAFPEVVGPAAVAPAPLAVAVRDTARRTALTAAAAVLCALLLTPMDGSRVGARHLFAVSVTAVAAAGAVALALRRERYEEELAAARTVAELGQRLGLAVEAAGLGTWSWNLQSGRVSWDSGTEQLFGLDAGRFGATFDAWLDAVHPEDRDVVRMAVADGMRAGHGWVIEHRVVTPDGTLRWIEGRGEVVRDRSGAVAGATGVALDVTDRRTREGRRRDDQRVLEAALALSARPSLGERMQDTVVAACAAARTVFGADAVTYLAVEGDCVRLLHHDSDRSDAEPGATIPLDAMPRTRRDLESLRPSLVTIDDDDLDDLTRFLMAAGGIRATVRVPLAAAGVAEAVLVLGWTDEVPATDRLDTFARFGDHVGWVVERARRREAEAEATALSSRLQEGLLVAPVLTRSGVAAHTAYRPGEARLLLGGDFFDAVGRPDGTVAFCIGDVSGHGPEEAALAAQVRAGWRAVALSGSDPARWVGDLDRVVRTSSVDPERFITVCCGSLDPTHRTLTVVSAGHPPPIVLGGDEGPFVVEAPVGPPLGIDEDQAWVACAVELPHDWCVAVYTDGLVEGRAEPGSVERYGFDRLVARLAGPDVEPTVPFIERLLDDVERANGGRLADDVAVLLLVPHGTPAVAADDPGAVAAVLEIGSRLEDVARARRFVRRTLAGWGVTAPVDDVVLATSELVTNASLHAGTRTWVRVAASTGTIRVEVGDGRPPTDELLAWARHPDSWAGTTGRGLLVVSQVADDWGVRSDGDGKVVWFQVRYHGGSLPDVSVEVAFRNLPSRLLLAFEEHLETLVREARYVLRGPDAPVDVEGALHSDIDGVIQRYDPLRVAVRRVARLAATTSKPTVDAVVAVPRSLADDLTTVVVLMEQFEALGASGNLLMLPPGEELAAFRRWLVGELVAQVRGATPSTCPFA